MKKVIIMEGNAETAEEIAVAVRMAGLEVAGVTNDGEEGLKMIGIEKPDVAVIGLVLKGIDGFGVLERVQREHAAVKLIVTGGYSDDAIIEKVLAAGVKYYLMKPIAAEVVAERVKEVAEGEKGAAAAKEKKNAVTLDEKISNIFISIGIPPHIKGYGYLREGIKLAVERPGIINNVTKELYPQIAEKFNTTASKVERAKKLLFRRVDALLEAAVLLPVCMADPDQRTENAEKVYLLLEELLKSFERHGIRVSLSPLLETQMPNRCAGNTFRRANRRKRQDR